MQPTAFARPCIALVRRVLAIALLCAIVPANAADRIDTIARVKRSVVAVGTFDRDRSPPFVFRGTGFAVADGATIVTNAHVLPASLDVQHNEVLAILSPSEGNETAKIREVGRAAVDPTSDLALLRLAGGEPLQPLSLRDSATVHEGQEILMTGFPLGGVLGPFAATHRGMIAAITPIAIPQGNATQLNPAVIHRLTRGSFSVFQLDATAYPGNSGSPIYDPANGDVLGIVNMVFVKGTKEAALTQPSGITYAVPASRLLALMKSLK
jgi:S1-C subfamily serine protease